jgi:hypothetical protein
MKFPNKKVERRRRAMDGGPMEEFNFVFRESFVKVVNKILDKVVVDRETGDTWMVFDREDDGDLCVCNVF